MADNNQEELREMAKAALLLCTIKLSTFDNKTNQTLLQLKNKFSGRSNGGGGNPVALPQMEFHIPDWNPPEIPPVAMLNGFIGNCSKPFEKQLTDSDVRDDQSRLSINKADVENYLLPLLNNPEENLENGIPVIVYDYEGEEYQMMFKIWASKFHVLKGEWKKFCHEHNLQKLQDFVTLWMFRHVETEKLCFVITSRKLRVNTVIKRRRVG